jgi:type I restriction enzyme S subunit
MSKPTKLPEGWKLVSLGEVGTLINGDRGKNYPSQKDFVDNGVPFINAGHIQNGEIDFESMNFISRKRFDLLGSGKVKSGDILYCLRGSLGKTAIIKDIQEGAIASSLVIIRPSEQIRTDYFYRYLASPIGQAEIYKYDNGSSQPNLSAQSLKQYQLPLPPLEEQRRIAAILDKADGVRRKRKEAIRLTEELLKSTFLEMFGDSERNFREHYGQDCFLPLEKCIERFIDYRGKTPTKGNSGVPLITAKIIKNGRIQPPNEFIARENYDSWMRRGLPQLGDVLFTTEAPLGEVAQVDDPDIALAQRVLLMRGKSNILDNTYLFGTLQSSFVRDQIERRSTGSTVKGIRQKELRKVVIPIPPIVLQRKYASFAVSQQKCTDRQKLLFKESENLFNSLLQRAFRGEL